MGPARGFAVNSKGLETRMCTEAVLLKRIHLLPPSLPLGVSGGALLKDEKDRQQSLDLKML